VAPRLTHIALRATDLDRSVAFHGRYAGLVVAHERTEDGTKVIWLTERAEDPDFVFVLIPMPHSEGERTGCITSASVASRADVDAIAARRAPTASSRRPRDAQRSGRPHHLVLTLNSAPPLALGRRLHQYAGAGAPPRYFANAARSAMHARRTLPRPSLCTSMPIASMAGSLFGSDRVQVCGHYAATGGQPLHPSINPRTPTTRAASRHVVSIHSPGRNAPKP
jgi:catechol 2,3-dioxygenase-like lactoylglutathione lyase family enzyme